MNHRKSGRILSRGRNQRRALLKTMLGSLIVHGHIETTEAKAKELKEKIDSIVNKAKRASDETRRVAVIRELRRYLPQIAIESLLSEESTSRFAVRGSGYTRVVKLDARKGDGAKMAVIEFV